MPIIRPKKFFYGYVVLVAVWFVYFTNMGVLLYSISAMNAKMVAVEQGQFSSTVIGLAVGLCTLLQGVGSAAAGPSIVRIGCKRFLLIGTVILVASSLGMAILPANYVMLYLFYGVGIGVGLGLAGTIPAQAAVNDWFNEKKALAMAFMLTAGAVGGFVGPLGAKYFIALGGWRWGWFYGAAVCAVSCVVVILLVVGKPAELGQYPDGIAPERQAGDTRASAPAPVLPISEVLRDPTAHLYNLNLSTRNLFYVAVTGHIVIYLTGEGMSYDAAVLLISVLSISSLAGRLFCGALPENFISPKYTLCLANILMAAGLAISVFLPTVPAAYFGSAMMGVGLGYGHVGSPVFLSRIYGPENFAAVAGGMAPINSIIAGGGPVLVGIAAATMSYRIPYLVTIVLGLVGGVCVLAVKEDYMARRPAWAVEKDVHAS